MTIVCARSIFDECGGLENALFVEVSHLEEKRDTTRVFEYWYPRNSWALDVHELKQYSGFCEVRDGFHRYSITHDYHDLFLCEYNAQQNFDASKTFEISTNFTRIIHEMMEQNSELIQIVY